MAAETGHTSSPDAPLPEGIFTFLDTDLYKFTMQSAVLKNYPEVEVTYRFTNRTPHMQLNREAFDWLQGQIRRLANISATKEELEYLRTAAPKLGSGYLDFLSNFRLKPDEHVRVEFKPADQHDGSTKDERGEVVFHISGRWVDTILFEIPLLALTSEAYFKFCDRDWNYDGQEEKARAKGLRLFENGCAFSEFGTRRRRNYKTHDLVLQGLLQSQKDAEARGLSVNRFSTSNPHFAMRYKLPVIGTVGHEWCMGIAAITGSYESANETALERWVAMYGEGVFSTALTDTFGTPSFLKAFGKPISAKVAQSSEKITFAQAFVGVRQDSGDPLEFVETMRDFYAREQITTQKTLVFSDSLNVDKCIKYRQVADAAGFNPSFGIGTFLTNDFHAASDPSKKSSPLNIVIKLASANGRPAIKLSDNMSKNTGDGNAVAEAKRALGYLEKEAVGFDESQRW